MSRQEVLNEYFIEARAHLLELAAFMDRVQRADGPSDFRWREILACLPVLLDDAPDKTRRILEHLSDPTTSPIPRAPMQGAWGAWPGDSSLP